MATLNGKKVSESYKDLLQVSNSNSGVDATLQTVEDGEGTSSSLKLSDRQAEVLPAADGTAVFDVSKSDGTSILSVDTTNSKVIATELDISGNVDIDGTTNLDTVDIDGEVNVGGNYTVHDAGRQNHVANTMPAPSMHFNSDTYGFIDSNSKYDAGTNDFSIEVRFKLETGTQLFLSHISGWLVNGWVLRAYDGGSGSNVWRVRLDQDGTGLSTLDYNPNATWEFGKWVHAVFTFDRSGNLTIYQDGVSVATTSITSYSGAISSGSGKFGLGTYTGNNAGSYKDVEISHIRWHNRLLSADEVKHYYSGGSVPFKYQGADNTHRITSGTAVGAGGGTINSSSSTAVNFSSAGTFNRVGWALSSTMEKGKIYKISWTGLTSSSGNMQLRTSNSSVLNDNPGTNLGDFSGGAGSVTHTATGEETHIHFKNLGHPTTFTVTGFDVREIGCVIDLDPSGVASDKWLDKSGNDLHANMTNGAVHNAPTSDDGLVYEEGVHQVAITGHTSGEWDATSDDAYLNYVRIGNLVHVSGYLETQNDLGATGYIKITLPYASVTGLSHEADRQYGFCSISHGGSTVSGMTSGVYIPENLAYFHVFYVQDDGTYSYFSDSNLDDTFKIRLGFTYRI